MRLEQSVDKKLIVNDIRNLINLAIDVFSAFFVKEQYHLTRREKEFFVGCVLAYRGNVSLHGVVFTNFMINTYKFATTERAIYNMRDIIKNKKWLIQTQFGYDIPPLFKQDLDKLSVNLKVSTSQN